MSGENSDSEREGPFPSTSLTLHQRLLSGSPADSEQAMGEFFDRYWYPLYAFMRAQGESHHDASDLVQEFVVTQFLPNESFRKWDPEKGKLRTFLKTILDRFRKKEFRKASAQKRGGPKAQTHVSMDFEWAKGQFDSALAEGEAPDVLFEREWAEAVVQQVMERLTEKYAAKDRLEEFRILIANFGRSAGDSEKMAYQEIAAVLQTSEGNVKQKMRQLRQHFEIALGSVVSETVEPSEVEQEVNFVLQTMLG